MRKVLSFSFLAMLREANAQLWQRISPKSDIMPEYEVESDIIFKGDLLALFEDFYRLEYVYSALKNKPFFGTERRKEKILQQVRKVFSEVVEELRGLLYLVFDNWLAHHAINNPEDWARNRIRGLDTGFKFDWEILFHEYLRYFREGRFLQFHARPSQIDPVIQGNVIDNILSNPEIEEIFWDALGGKESWVDSEITFLMEEWETDPQDIIDRFGLVINESMNPETVEGFVREKITESTDLSEILANYNFIELLGKLPMRDQEKFLFLFARDFVFPEWFQYWEPQGIVETRERIVKARDKLMQENISLEQKYAIINHAINLSHQTGSMLEYVGDAVDESSKVLKQRLNELSAGDFVSKLNPILQESGIKV